VVIPAIGDLKALWFAVRELMHSYHNVAELRQFHGASEQQNDRSCVESTAF
jgi:hypothetical protein